MTEVYLVVRVDFSEDKNFEVEAVVEACHLNAEALLLAHNLELLHKGDSSFLRYEVRRMGVRCYKPGC